ncbi:MmgE/PrpD family protein [Halalkalirubrum salinum]|uniref:MmgE/PrpD family protein n=1 Tax=Halalkalirubrum salinum TaxID=2563889 RepID=UPI0010FB4537|nr:MmgE/PrpD family protein [Halalkalirubrum salinum]
MTGQPPPASTHALEIGKVVTDFSLKDLPEDAIEHATHLVLDSVGVMLGGSQLRQANIVTSFWSERGGAAEATVPSTDTRLPVTTAAYLNGYLANLLDYDDTYSGRAIGHPGATVIPPTLAVAEAYGADTRSFLEAVIIGYEVSIRIGDAIMPSPERSQEVVGTGTWQIFGPAVATAKLLDCSPEAVADALGIAGMNAPVPLVRKVGINTDRFQWLKNNYGWACLGGVIAGELASRGFRGSRDIFDGPSGFWRMAASDSFEESVLHADLDNWCAITDVSFKPYSSCRWTHATLDCVRELRAEGLDPDAVERVEVSTFHEGANLDSIPDTVLDAQFSMPFVVAVALLGYDPGFEWLAEERLSDPDVWALMKRVDIKPDETMSSWYESTGQMAADVTVRLRDGTECTASVDHPRGEPERPLPYAEVRNKYRQLAEPLLGANASQELESRIRAMPGSEPVGEIASLLGATNGS